MNDIRIIFLAELLRKVRSRPFTIGTLVGAIAILGISALPSFLNNAVDSATRRIVLAGDAQLVDAAAKLLAGDYTVVARLPRPAAQPTIDDLYVHDRASAFVIVERHAGHLAVTAYARDPGNFDSALARDLVPLNVALAVDRPLASITPYLTVDTRVKSLDAKFVDPASADAARGVAYILVMLLYMSILLNSQSVMASVAEEKTSRIAEILVATTSPAQLLTAKILAAGVTGLIQLGVWIVVGIAGGGGILTSFAGRTAHHAQSAHAGGTVDISAAVAIAFLLFFIVGFMQYATLYAAAASLINRTEDLSSVAAPLLVPVIGGFFLAQYTLAFPHAAYVAVLSVLPLVSPFVMFTRMAITSVPGWEIALALAVNVASTIVILWGAGKVYRVGLLLYGRPPSFKQVVAALRV